MRILIVATMVPTAYLAFAPSSRADNVGPDQTGWWFAAQQLPSPAPALPRPPVAPAGGLYIAYDGSDNPAGIPVNAPISGTVAYGAVRYSVTPGSQGTLTLKVATGSNALTAQLRACRTTGSWAAADGGAWYAQPGFDGSSCAEGTVDASGASVVFAVPASFTTDGVVDVAIAPKPGATPFQVAFERPASDSLIVTGGRTQLPSARPPTAAGPSAVPASPAASSSDAPHVSGTPAASTAAATSGASPPPGPSATNSRPVTEIGAGHGPDAGRRLVAFALLAALGAAWWWLSSPGRAFVFAAAADGRRSAADRDVFGVGRFARRRDVPVAPL
jgi:hypothetical protein